MRGKLFYCIQPFLTKPAISLLIVLQIFVLLGAANITLGEYNSRTMLYEPFQPYIDRQGFFINDMSGDNRLHEDKIKEICDFDILKLVQYSTANEGDVSLNITVIPDEVFDALDLPLSEGKKYNSNEPGDKAKVIVTHNTSGISAGDTVGGINDSGFEVAAMLTDPTYIMDFSYNIEMSYEEMYLNYESSFYNGQAVFYTSESQFGKANAERRYIHTQKMCLAAFKTPVSTEKYEAVKKALTDRGYLLIENDTIRERSEKILSDDFKRLMPAVFVFGIIVVIGIISCSVIGAKNQIKRLGIFYCCGAVKSSCIFISVGQTVMICIVSAAAATAALLIMRQNVLGNMLGFVFGRNNIIMSAGIMIGSIAISAIAPILLISKANPRELLTNAAQE